MKRHWKIVIATGILLVLLGASVLVPMHVQPANQVDAYKKFLRAKGEKLDLSEVLPPPVAPESNSVDAVEEAFGLFGSGTENIPNAMRMVAPGKAMVGWRQPDARGFDFTNSWDEFAATVEADRPALELLHQVLDRPTLEFQLDYRKGAMMLLPHLAPMKRATQKLDAASILELHNGDCGAATTNLLIELALVHKDFGDDLLISHLVRLAMTAIAVIPTWELLQATNVTDAQLLALQNGWQQIDWLGGAENAFVMERVFMDAHIQKSRDSHGGFRETFGMTFSGGSYPAPASGGSDWPEMLEDLTQGPRQAVAETLWRSSWSYTSEMQMLKDNQIILETLRTMQTNRSQCYKADYDAMSSRLASLGFTNAGNAFLSALKIPDFSEYFGDLGLSAVVRKTILAETARRIVITAIALKRFQLKRGQWPDTLAELAPEFIPSVPIDPYDGKPLKYHPNSDGTFLLYSVGEDGVDNGGDPTSTAAVSSIPAWQNAKVRDMVWPQPASPAEVRDFYEHPPK
jgi:hypothetical protein